MSFNVVWSKFSEKELDKIYNYYYINVSEKVALNIIIGIINSTTILTDSHFIGKLEELLISREFEYRRLIYKNYKIIYTVDLEKKLIKIADIFDMRQNPIKLKRIKQ